MSRGDRFPSLRMREWKSNIGPDVQIMCLSATARRGMLEATGPKAAEKLPLCRGRHPHLDAFYTCDQPGRLMMLGAANQWFSVHARVCSLCLARRRHRRPTCAALLRTLPKAALDDLQGVAG